MMRLLYLSHELRDNMKPFVRNDPQQSHQVFMLKLPGKIGATLRTLTGGIKEILPSYTDAFNSKWNDHFHNKSSFLIKQTNNRLFLLVKVFFTELVNI